MYPAYLEVAESQKEKGAKLSFHYAYCAEKIHASMFQQAKHSVDSAKDIELGPVQICEVCGYTHEGDIPDRCPICAARKDRFSTFT